MLRRRSANLLAAFVICIVPAIAQESPEQQLWKQGDALFKQGDALFKQGKFVDAAKVIESNQQCLSKYPELENLLGLTLLKLGKYEEARVRLTHVTQVKPSIEEAWLNLGLAYESLGNVSSAMESFKKYVSIAKDKATAVRVGAHIKDLERGSGTASSTAEDYFSDVTSQGGLRWSKKRMPVKVFIQNSSTVPGYRAAFEGILKTAFNAWTEASNGSFKFKFVDAAKDADILVKWTNDTKDVASIAEGGDVKFKHGPTGLNHVDLTILTLNPSKDQPLTDELVSWISLHEVGHAMGLLGHSTNPKDVMFVSAPQIAEAPTLTPRDKNTIVKLYTTDTWMTLNDEGTECIESGDIDSALKRYSDALKLSPNNRVVQSNLVRAKYKRAITLFNDNKKSEAEPYFKEALEIEDKIKDDNLGSVVKAYCQFLRLQKRDSEAAELEKKYGKH